MAQISPARFAAGDIVEVRGNRWIVEETVEFPDCTLLRLADAGETRLGARCRLLYPFDRPTTQKLRSRVRLITRRRWGHLLRGHQGHCRTLGELRAASSAAIDILPFQLEPALAVARGLATRLLLADEVGLGKTIQAGLMLAELQARGRCERALVLTPAGLREQWADEMARRFGIHAAVFDAASLRSMAGRLPFGLNPWAVEPVAIASFDFVKQPEVLRALTTLLWDLLIIDEAHQVAAAPQRSSAVSELARRARHVALLTATPHQGDEPAYQALCGIGQLDDPEPLAMFRRTRDHVGLGRRRRIHILLIRLSRDEHEMHRLLATYLGRVWGIGQAPHRTDLRLVAMVLGKRALSSAASLAASVERRLSLISGRAPQPSQAGLPFDAEEDVADVEPLLAAPAFDRIEEEQGVLERILAAAERARHGERKLGAIARVLRRVREPAVVFTEYRDTLHVLEQAAAPRRLALLHGGLSRPQRRAVVDAFNGGAAEVLLATDAGSEGLNLQNRCRVVINLELPWNPVRLEQRIGRVDRLGQSRTVHAIHLVARETAEETVLARLTRRVERIRTEADIALEVLHAARAGITKRG